MKTKTRPKISAILHLAADKYLSPTGYCNRRSIQYSYSCRAISAALRSYKLSWEVAGDLSDRIETGLRTLGLATCSFREFSEFTSATERQGARYLWLKFVALLAEEQGM